MLQYLPRRGVGYLVGLVNINRAKGAIVANLPAAA